MNVDPAICQIIRRGDIVSCRLTPMGSNYTFLARVQLGGQVGLAIYKPRDGEAPLWDFPSGTLYKREYAAYLLSRVLGWDFIPFTVIREGPHGIGTLQHFVRHDSRQSYYTLTDVHEAELKTVACFDLVANSTDRKPNHLVIDADGKLWSIDHGLTFHADMKIRTVIWDFCGEPIPDPLLAALANLEEQLKKPQGRLEELLELLDLQEVAALRARIAWVLTERVYPGMPGRYRQRRL